MTKSEGLAVSQYSVQSTCQCEICKIFLTYYYKLIYSYHWCTRTTIMHRQKQASKKKIYQLFVSFWQVIMLTSPNVILLFIHW